MRKYNITLDNKPKGTVIITGCDSGVGKNLVSVLLQMGYAVIYSYLENDPLPYQPQVYSKKMDLRQSEEIKAFCAFAKSLCHDQKLQAVILNAGVALGGPIENLPMEIFRDSFDINFFGAVEIIQALIPQLLRDKGKILVHGSMAGRVALPFLSPYVSTKFALEGFCDSLRRELNPFGVKTILLESAAIATPIWNKAKAQDVSFVDKKYLNSLYRFRDSFIDGGNNGMEVELAALKIASILSEKKPKARYIIARNPLSSRVLLHVPAFVLDKAVIKIFDMHYKK